MQTREPIKSESPARWQPRAGAFVQRETGGRHQTIRAQAKRRRLIANAVVVSSTAAVLALASVFYLVLSR